MIFFLQFREKKNLRLRVLLHLLSENKSANQPGKNIVQNVLSKSRNWS